MLTKEGWSLRKGPEESVLTEGKKCGIYDRQVDAMKFANFFILILSEHIIHVHYQGPISRKSRYLFGPGAIL